MRNDEQDELADDVLWSVAVIEVIAEKDGWIAVSEADYAYYRKYSNAANDDRRYPGILECQFENYDFDKAEAAKQARK